MTNHDDEDDDNDNDYNNNTKICYRSRRATGGRSESALSVTNFPPLVKTMVVNSCATITAVPTLTREYTHIYKYYIHIHKRIISCDNIK